MTDPIDVAPTQQRLPHGCAPLLRHLGARVTALGSRSAHLAVASGGGTALLGLTRSATLLCGRLGTVLPRLSGLLDLCLRAILLGLRLAASLLGLHLCASLARLRCPALLFGLHLRTPLPGLWPILLRCRVPVYAAILLRPCTLAGFLLFNARTLLLLLRVLLTRPAFLLRSGAHPGSLLLITRALLPLLRVLLTRRACARRCALLLAAVLLHLRERRSAAHQQGDGGAC